LSAESRRMTKEGKKEIGSMEGNGKGRRKVFGGGGDGDEKILMTVPSTKPDQRKNPVVETRANGLMGGE